MQKMTAWKKLWLNLPELLLLKILPLFYHHGYFWATTFDFQNIFHAVVFCIGRTFFYSLAVFM